jgi:hypothetical protein
MRLAQQLIQNNFKNQTFFYEINFYITANIDRI